MLVLAPLLCPTVTQCSWSDRKLLTKTEKSQIQRQKQPNYTSYLLQTSKAEPKA